MTVLTNHSSFAASTFGALDAQARAYDVVVVSAAFSALPGKPLVPVPEQPPVRDADEFVGDPALSSVRYEGETAWLKPGVDVLVNGQAHAPFGRAVERVLVSVRVGDVHKELQVSGDRSWGGLLGGSLSAPRPFTTMPIIYERAFGGTNAKQEGDPRNPVGVGFRGALPRDPAIQSQVANVEYPKQAITSSRQTPEPAGLGVVGRAWQPRLPLAGTYDAAWLAEQCPLLALDFDVRHFQAAPVDQQSTTLHGGEPVEVRNMTPDGLWQFSLPTLNVPVGLYYIKRRSSVSLKLDTVLLEPDLYRVTLIARAGILAERRHGPLVEIVVGHVTPAWKRARLNGKRYLDHGGRNGRHRAMKDFTP